MTLPVAISITKWNYRLSIEHGSENHVSEGRTLVGFGKSDFRAGLSASVMFHRGRSAKYASHNLDGAGELWPPREGREEHFGIEIDLPEVMWEEILRLALAGVSVHLTALLVGPIEQHTEIYQSLHAIGDRDHEAKIFICYNPTMKICTGC
ncbi:MAG TPA: hypothetical protein VMH86_02125 [Rhizomicrobium sp.]|nr:hypothetical protein [Rhizomicrobium sp.]